MKKIAFVIPNFNGGGAERVTINYIQSISSSRYDIFLICLDSRGPLSKKVPEHVTLIDIKTARASKALFPLSRIIFQTNPDVIFTTHHRITLLISLIRLLKPKIKHLARLTNMLSTQYENRMFGKMSKVAFSFAYRKASIIISQTDAMKLDAAKFLDVCEKKIITMSNPIDIGDIKRNTVSINRQKFEKYTAIASGRLVYQKGFDILIAAVSKIVKTHPNFRLLILGGDGGERENLEKLVIYNGCQQHIHFKGFVDNPYMYYVKADLFILSSRWEGFPNALLENYYLNTPIVATKCVPIIEDLIEDSVNGYLCHVNCVNSLAKAISLGMINLDRDTISNQYNFPSLEELINL